MTGSKWLLLIIPFLAILSSLHFQLTKAQILDPNEVNALNDIKGNLVDPADHLKNWGSGDPCNKNWTGVICYNTTLPDGYLHVQELQLLKMNLSGTLAPALGNLTYMKILDFMWNQITGSIPDEVGNITSLDLLLLNGNQLSGSLPDSIGYLPNLNRIQIDQNHISGPIPTSFANLNTTKHFHMNNNSLSGQIPPELSRLPNLVHLLLDSNNLSGNLPKELSEMPSLLIIQLDNNNFSGSSIPQSYQNMSKLLKMSLRNCSLQGTIPDLSTIPQIGYIDLSWNQLTGSIPTNKLSTNITTIDFSHNLLNGTIPDFSGLPKLQRLSLDDNNLSGTVPSNIWQGMSFTANRTLILDFQNNDLTNASTSLNAPRNVSLMLSGNPVCTNANLVNVVRPYCGVQTVNISGGIASNDTNCGPCSTFLDFEINPYSSFTCFCSIPFTVGYRLKSPGFTDFRPYYDDFRGYLTNGLVISLYQLDIQSFMWEEGPRLKMNLKFFPDGNNTQFSEHELDRIKDMFTGWLIPDSDIYGPYELLNFTEGSYSFLYQSNKKSGLSTGAVVGIALGAFAGAAIVATFVTIIIMRRNAKYRTVSKKKSVSRIPMKIDGLKSFTFEEMAQATNDFSNSAQVGQGGYGKVYKGILADGTVVAIKRAQEGSLQGSKEFFTEIELLSRLHHRNLVALLGYCDEEDEQMLVYEFMPNGTLRDHLSGKRKEPLSFSTRLRIALASARGILYLHMEADPPIFHRDIKASNILLDSKMVAKVADFGLSRLAPVPNIEGDAPSHVSTVVKGTPGYLDPEYFLTHKLTDKSDVYSLGVVFLELLTGMQPITYGKNLVREVMMASQSGHIFSVVDSNMGSYTVECIQKFAALALSCCRDETNERPSMKEVVRELEAIWPLMPEGELGISESLSSSDYAKKGTPSSSSSLNVEHHQHPFVSSSDVSGSNLLSGAMPSITPR
ncbi:putative LRR receptor-like serine/threonine-protein kinase [Carex littledalei]|uniref:non-specific serine/threonine protein kinase n=1 Tax=Carex littledalei TaxID=544730 RepID=A0A833R8U4_9POAL|nr:putative LRR receptor-like serine/threonine-protein kinase [Carex littledalei]